MKKALNIMKMQLLFIGNKFIYNKILQEYIIRKVEQKCDFIHATTLFQDGDNSLFLHLEEKLESDNTIVIITTKSNFSTVGKLISTVTSDNQILKDTMLIPSKVEVYEKGSYLLKYKKSVINVICVEELEKIPEILINQEEQKTRINIFNEQRDNAVVLLSSIAQTYDVHLEITTIIDGWLQVELESKKYGNVSNCIASMKQLYDRKLIVKPNIIEHIIEVLASREKKLSFAESCTGGLLTYYFTAVNGASQILDGSLITYSNELKDNWLAVDHNTLEEYGAVSNEVVEQMSEGAINVSHADYAISVSGIAGDTGGTESKPVGTVYISVRTKNEHKEEHLQLKGDRNYVQHQSVLHALKMLVSIDKNMFF